VRKQIEALKTIPVFNRICCSIRLFSAGRLAASPAFTARRHQPMVIRPLIEELRKLDAAGSVDFPATGWAHDNSVRFAGREFQSEIFEESVGAPNDFVRPSILTTADARWHSLTGFSAGFLSR